MKKALLSLAFFGLAASSQAAFIQCLAPGAATQATVFASGSGSSVTFTCSPGTGGAGFQNLSGDSLNLATFELQVSGTMQNNSGAQQVYGVTFNSVNSLTANPPLDAAIGNVFCTASAASNASGQAIALCNGTSGVIGVNPGVDFLNTFTVTVTGVGAPTAFNGSASVAYQVTTIPQTGGVPEPSTYGMMGTGLIGLYFARRRKKA